MKIRNIARPVADGVIHTGILSIKLMGNLFCILAGMGLAAPDILDETVTFSYYAAGIVAGTFYLYVANFLGYTLDQKTPVEYEAELSGEQTYDMKDIINPRTVEISAVGLAFLGTLVNVWAAALEKWNTERIDRRYYREKKHEEVENPSWKEYALVTGGSACGSIATILSSFAICHPALSELGSRLSKQALKYPSGNSGQPIVRQHYHGPVLSHTVPVSVNRNISIPLVPGKSIQGKAGFDAKGTGQFGEQVQTHPNRDFNPGTEYLAIGFIITATLINNFFNTQVRHKRDKRIERGIPHILPVDNSTRDNTRIVST